MPKQTNDSELNPQLYSDTLQLHTGNSRILYQKSCKLDVFAPIFSKDYWQEKKAITGSASGRGQTLFIRHKSSELILRPYLRGGLPGKILTDQFFFTGFEKTRAWREFLLLLDIVIIKRIPNAKDLHQVLSERVLPNETLSNHVWHSIGATISQFHRHQVYHHDLNIKNIMLDHQQKTWLIDFDRCGIIPGHSWKQKNLDRLHRSLVKEKNKNPAIQWTEENWQALLTGYQKR